MLRRVLRWSLLVLPLALLIPAQAPSEDGAAEPALLRTPCAEADPFDKDVGGTLDAGNLSCSGLPRNC